jgi:hypothetical protein
MKRLSDGFSIIARVGMTGREVEFGHVRGITLTQRDRGRLLEAVNAVLDSIVRERRAEARVHMAFSDKKIRPRRWAAMIWGRLVAWKEDRRANQNPRLPGKV